jgi:hypothetical protein
VVTKDEASDLALEALEFFKGLALSIEEIERAEEAITAIKQARSAPVQDSTCSEALRAQGKAYPRTCRKCGKGPCIELANAALDKKAENARELGLDYDPVWDNLPSNKDVEEAMRMKRLHQLATPPAAPVGQYSDIVSDGGLDPRNKFDTTPPAAPVQEPLFWYKPHPNGMFNGPIHNAQLGDILRGSEEWVPLYTTPPAAQRQWVGLTDEELTLCHSLAVLSKKHDDTDPSFTTLLHCQIEAKLKEKNT